MSSTSNSPQPSVSRLGNADPSAAPTTSYFTSSIATPMGGKIESDTSFRRYVSAVQTVSKIGGNADTSTRKIIYEVGRAVSTVKAALAKPADSVVSVDTTYPTGSVLSEDFSGFARKYSNFSATFTHSNLASVVELIAATLATVSVFKDVSTANMRRGNEYKIVALGTLDSPVSASEDSVFIPRQTDSVLAPDVFSVLASAVAGCGSQVVTDVVALDNTNKPIVREVKDAALAKACVDALRILGSNFSAADVGDLFAYAVTRGIHSVVSVVGHTDEGGVIRSCLRKSAFCAPFGGIHYALGAYVGLPALSSTSPTSIAGYVDTIALKTAGLVAHCDPGVMLNGSWFPTVLVSSADSDEKKVPGETEEGTDTDVSSNRLALLNVFSDFARQYCQALAKLFLFTSSSGIAERHFQETPAWLSNEERHLKYKSLSPFFWVEPTSLVPRNFLGSKVENEGFGAYASPGEATTLPAFEEIYPFGLGSTTKSGYIIKFRGARASPFLAHWNGNVLNGLGNIQVRQLDPNAIVHPGVNSELESVRARVEESSPLSKFLWTRGQSPFAAPAEMLNIAKTMGIMVVHNTTNDDGDMTMGHVPQSYEFLDTTVTFHVSRPAGLKMAASNAGTSTCARARTRATRELAAAILRAQMFGRADVIDMPVLTTAPPLPSEIRARQNTPNPQGSSGPNTVRGEPVVAPVSASGPQAQNAAPNPVSLQHSPHRAPVVQRGAGVIPTGTAAPVLPSAVGGNTESTATPQPPANQEGESSRIDGEATA